MARLRRSKRVVEGSEHLEPAYVIGLLDRLSERYSARNTQILALRRMRFMEDKEEDEVPEAFREGNPAIRTYVAGKWVENEVGALTTLPPSVHVPIPADAELDDRDRAERIERFLPALLERMERERGRDTKRLLFDQAIADGVGVLKGIFKPSMWQKMPSARKFASAGASDDSEDQIIAGMTADEVASYDRALERFIQNSPLPIACRNVDPCSVYPVHGEFGIDAVIEDSERSLIEVRRLAGPFGGLPLSTDDPAPGPTVRVVEYWDDEFMAVYAGVGRKTTEGGLAATDGGLRLIGTMKHSLGRIPYWFIYGQETSSTDPRFESISTLFKIRDGVPAFHRALNQYLNIVRAKAYPPFQQKKASTGPTDAASEPMRTKVKPGHIHYVDDSIDDPFIRAIAWPDSEVNLPVLMNLLLAVSQQTQIEQAATGGDRRSGESAALRGQMVDLARTGYHQIIEHAENMLADFFGWCLEMIDTKLKRPVYVLDRHARSDSGSHQSKWMSLGSEDIKGDYAVDVRITPFNPIMDIAKGTYGANMILSGIYPRRWTYENIMGIENAQELVDELITDKIEQSPPVSNAIMLRGARKAGLTELAGSQNPVTPGEAQLLAAMGGSMGGRPAGQAGVGGVGAPLSGAANQPGSVPIGPAGNGQE